MVPAGMNKNLSRPQNNLKSWPRFAKVSIAEEAEEDVNSARTFKHLAVRARRGWMVISKPRKTVIRKRTI
jgi:hypothetical protein